jgi:hypothetical protein
LNQISDRRWKQLVREGKALVLEGAKNRLRLGEMSQEIDPITGRGGDHGNQYTGGKARVQPLAQFAEEIDTTVDLLEECRQVWNRWGGQAPGISWSNLLELSQPNRHGLDPQAAYAAVKKAYGKVNILTVRNWKGTASAGVRSTSPVSDKLKQFRELASDPEVMDAAGDDPETQWAVNDIHNAIETKRGGKITAHRERVSNDLGFGDTADRWEIEEQVEKADLAIRVALTMARGNLGSAKDRKVTVGRIDKLDTHIGWLRTILTSGSMDDELVSLLNGEDIA